MSNNPFFKKKITSVPWYMLSRKREEDQKSPLMALGKVSEYLPNPSMCLGTGLRWRFSSEQTDEIPALTELPSHGRGSTKSQVKDVVRRR